MSHPRKHFIERSAFSLGYRVSPDGRSVFSLSAERNVSIRLDTWGYPRFTVSLGNSEVRQCSVHRLQAYQKFGEKVYEPGVEVRHLDDISTNNSADNIALGTHAQNMMDRPPELRRRIAGQANLKHDRNAIRAFYAVSQSYKLTMAEFGITSKGTLHHILKTQEAA